MNIKRIHEVAEFLAEDIAYILNLELLGSGNYRCALKLDKIHCIKLSIEEEYEYMNRKETELLKHLKKVNKELIKFLIPVEAYTKKLNIMPIAEKVVGNIPRIFKNEVFKLFEKSNIFLVDITKDKNWGIYNGHPLLLDYADWYKI